VLIFAKRCVPFCFFATALSGSFFVLCPTTSPFSGGNFMKTFSKKLLALLLVIVSAFAFAGCGDSYALDGQAKVVIAGQPDKVYTVDLEQAKMTSQNTVLDLLGYLCETQDLEFSASANGSGQYGYSAFLTSIGQLNPQGNEYIGFFHNKKADKDVSEWAADDVTVGEDTLYYSGLGIGSVKLVDGIVVYFNVLSY